VQLADRASRLYAPVVHATALLTMLGWVLLGASWHDAIVTAIAVLIITCPCALGLAIPAVQTVAAGAMFRNGVLINSGDAIERVADIDIVVFDKTGTLTLPELDVVNAAGMAPEILELAGRLALSSHHPVARAVARASEAKSPLLGVTEEPGQGVRAMRDGVELRLGSPSFCGAERQANEILGNDPEVSVVAFRRGALPEVIADGTTGFLVEPDDLRAAAEAVKRAPALSRRACRERAERELDIERSLDAHERLYERVAGVRRGARAGA